MLPRHAVVTREGCRAGALCHGAHSARVLALSRATGRLGPGGACHSEPIQSRQPVPLASVALLLRRARFDDVPWVDLGFAALGPAFSLYTHSLLCCSQLGRSSEAKEMTKEGERGSVAVWREKMTPALTLAPKYSRQTT